MPFNCKNRRPFRKNDIIYGLQSQREIYVENWILSIGSSCPLVIDTYAVNDYERNQRVKINEKAQKEVCTVPDNEKLFIDLLASHNLYKIALDFKKDSDLSKKKIPTFTSKNDELTYQKKKFAQHINMIKAIKAKCKGGLLWYAVMKNGSTVHFILDGIDMGNVIKKEFSYETKYGMERSITGSELRWIYRNKHLKEVQNCIQFWYKSKPVNPPWEWTSKEDWAVYKPKKQIKFSLFP